MRDANLEAVGKTEDDEILLVIDVEMGDGPDLDGKVQFQWAAINTPDGPSLALLTPGGDVFQDFGWNEKAEELLDLLIEHEGYMAGMNYENLEWEEMDGGTVLPILGRKVGLQFDHVEDVDLGEANMKALREMRDVLQEHY